MGMSVTVAPGRELCCDGILRPPAALQVSVKSVRVTVTVVDELPSWALHVAICLAFKFVMVTVNLRLN